MDNDLISREALKKALRQRQYYIEDIEEVINIINNAPDVPTHYTDGYKTGFREGYRQALTDINDRFKNKMQEILEEVNTDVKTTTE